ncbi:MAG: hypothetical protein JKZ01_08495, partial [SAR324 cluster bacterium]|nr:hypothetical protein [SAR324 cluster bacterium]
MELTAEQQLENKRYKYPSKAYQTIKISKKHNLIPLIPEFLDIINVIKTELPGI